MVVIIYLMFKIIVGDLFQVQIYILCNGMILFFFVNLEELCIYINIVVCVGFKQDLVDVIGLAYYMEYMFFKGISCIGVLDWVQELKFLEQILDLYEQYCVICDLEECCVIYQEIDCLFNEVVKFVAFNEYDLLFGVIGVKDINVYIFVD